MFLFMICFVPVENSYLKTLLHLPQHIIPLVFVILWLCCGRLRLSTVGLELLEFRLNLESVAADHTQCVSIDPGTVSGIT